MDEHPNDIERLLAQQEGLTSEALDLPAAPNDLREALFAKTSTAIRRRTIRKRVTSASLIVLAFIAGSITSAGLLRNDSPDTSATTQLPLDNTRVATPETPTAPATIDVPVSLILDPEAFTFRIQNASHEEKLILFRAAGDFYIESAGDIKTAVQLYERFFETLGEASTASPSINDNWLFHALYQARLEEIDNENTPA